MLNASVTHLHADRICNDIYMFTACARPLHVHKASVCSSHVKGMCMLAASARHMHARNICLHVTTTNLLLVHVIGVTSACSCHPHDIFSIYNHVYHLCGVLSLITPVWRLVVHTISTASAHSFQLHCIWHPDDRVVYAASGHSCHGHHICVFMPSAFHLSAHAICTGSTH